MASTSSFVAYIDESGDEGFTFGVANRSSEWFVLSAIVIRKKNDLSIVEACRSIRRTLGKPVGYTVHFRDLKHDQKVAVACEVSKIPMRTISIVCHKPSMTETEYLLEKNKLYFYLSRFLFERVSWLCRDNRIAKEGDGTAEIVFSNRSSMPYDEFRKYVDLLHHRSTERGDVEMDWGAIDSSRVCSYPHKLRAGLQIADIVASSVFSAFEQNRFGNTEPRYARELAKVAYRHKKKLLGYGVKLWPAEKMKAVQSSTDYDWLV